MNIEELQQKNEDCRRAVRAYLAARPAVAQAASTITRGLRAEWGFSEVEVANALGFLRSLDQIKQMHDSLGSTLYYRITAIGTLAHERS